MFNTRLKTHHSAMADGGKYLLGPKNLIDILQQKDYTDKQPATIYIHVPFCSKICSFCNMRRSLQEPHKQYADWIVEEIASYGSQPACQELVFDAVYFGGGTPTTLGTEDLRKILRALKHNFIFTATAEITIETTVTELTEDKIHMFEEEGVNRFSVGVQTFNDEGRRRMNRVGNGSDAYEKLVVLKKAGFATISMDLIYNYSGQTIEDLGEDLRKMVSLDVDGFSMYSLINMKEANMEEAQGIDNDEKMFLQIAETMEIQGYRFLELTKMVRKDEYKYIMNRHQGADTLPLGAGAGGSIFGLGIMNPINLEEYQNSVTNFIQRKGMLMNAAYKDNIIFKGDIQTGYLPRNISLYQDMAVYNEMLYKLTKENYVVKEGMDYRLTHKGVFWGNTISRELASLIK